MRDRERAGLRAVIQEIELGMGGAGEGGRIVAHNIGKPGPGAGDQIGPPFDLEQLVAGRKPGKEQAVGGELLTADSRAGMTMTRKVLVALAAGEPLSVTTW